MSNPRVLTLNAGSSTLKLALFEAGSPPRRLLHQTMASPAASHENVSPLLDAAIEALGPHGGLDTVTAIGHRVVHGGPRYAAPQLLTDEVLLELRGLVALDPDHMPAEIALIEAVRARAPTLPQVACFDTAFHRTMPRVSRLLPIPRRYEARGVLRYGFHGLSYTFLVEELARVAGEQAAHGRVILAQLGSGASLAAVRDGRCVDTTMGFTPNSGIPMGTRSGDLDAGVILYLMREERAEADGLDDLLSRRSGLLGMSETSSDVRELLAREATDPRAADALALFCHETRKAIGALATTMGGVETIVFSGGIGENAAPVRARVAEGLEHLGVHLDEARNARSSAVISTDASACTMRVIRTDEESIIARETLRVTGGTP